MAECKSSTLNAGLYPKIRFSGFTNPWKQRKLGDVFEDYSEKNCENLPALMIVQGGGTLRRDESERNLMYDKANLSNYKRVNEGDFIVHLRSFEGGLEMATNTGIISPAYHTMHGKNTDSRFYYSYFRSKKFIDIDLKPHVYGIRDGRSIDIEGMKTIQIPYTNFAEQKAIGDYIEQLDNLITLHQHKCDALLENKACLLQKMFPKDGEIVPEIRFPGFEGEWEKRKLGEFTTESCEKGHSGKEASKLTVKLHTKGVCKMDEKIQGSDNTQYYIRHAGQLIYGKQNFFNGAIGIVPEELEGYESTKDVPAFDIDDSVNVEWLYQYIARPEIYKPQEINSAGTGSKRLHVDTFFDLEITVPSLDEQAKIALFFRFLDAKISLQKQKVETLKEIKKAMLQQMFV